jgi:hypothetical protein
VVDAGRRCLAHRDLADRRPTTPVVDDDGDADHDEGEGRRPDEALSPLIHAAHGSEWVRRGGGILASIMDGAQTSELLLT